MNSIEPIKEESKSKDRELSEISSDDEEDESKDSFTTSHDGLDSSHSVSSS